jgi:hypothetical protein
VLWTTSEDIRRIFLNEMKFWRKLLFNSGIREEGETVKDQICEKRPL